MTPAKLQSLTVKELRALATEQGIPHATRMLKAELVAALSAKPGAGEGTGARERARRKASFTAPASGGKDKAPSSLPPQPPVAQPPAQSGTDMGLPIPDRYGVDRLVLMVQDPHHIFAYWELTPDTLERVRGAAGGGTPVLVLHGGQGDESREVDLHGGNYYLSVAPSASYEAELALRDQQGRLYTLAKSNRVTTPAPSISSRADEQWMGVDDTFHELLELAGLPDQPGGSSAQSVRMTEQRLVAWGWQESGVKPFSSGVLSSHVMSSSSLVRRERQRPRK